MISCRNSSYNRKMFCLYSSGILTDTYLSEHSRDIWYVNAKKMYEKER